MSLKDKDIREPLFLFLEEMYGRTRFIEEKTMGHSRADVLMVTDDQLIGIEIKSDADTYQRLESQVKDYDSFCDMNYVAVGSSHAMHVAEHVPEYWGIITIDEVDGEADFYILRKPAANPRCRQEQKIRLLWRRELANIQLKNGMFSYKDKSKAFVQKKILETIPEERFRRQFCEELFERDYTTIEEEVRSYREGTSRKKPYRKRQSGRMRR